MSSTSSQSPLVLVTGANGFVGTQVALAFLEAGFRVRATVRDAAKGKAWDEHHPGKHVEWAVVKDITQPEQFTDALKGVDVVAHTASPFHYNAKDAVKDMLEPAVSGTKACLEACAKASSVKRVVLTSSFASVLDMSKGTREGYTYTHEDFNPATWEEAAKSDPQKDAPFLYCASKVLAENAAWDFVKTNKPGFELSVVCPPLVLGPPQQVVKDLSGLNTSASAVWGLVDAKEIPPTEFPVWTDVRDIALAHVLAATKPEAAGQRYLTIAGHFSNDQVAAALAKDFPDQASRIPKSDGKGPPPHFKTDSSKAEKELGIKWISFEQCIRDTGARLFEIEKELKGNK